MMSQTEIQGWYAGKNIFITGGTGFMGKVLVEKLLRDVPQIGDIYLLLRPKKGLEPQKRIQLIQKLPIFDRVNKMNSKLFDKVKIVEGTLTDDNLGLSKENIELLQNNVHIVYHMAANLKMEAPLKEAVTINTIGTKQILDMCKSMKHLQCFLYLSTAFCNCDIEHMEEKLYKPHDDPYEIMKYVQETDEDIINAEQKKIIQPHPNCYTYTKRLSEWLVKDYQEYFPVAIARPSIVIPAVKEPMPGWVDSLNGPMGILAAGGKGVLRSMLGNRDNPARVVPVDIAINYLIIQAFIVGSQKKSLMVFNITIPPEVVSMTWGEIVDLGKEVVKDYPYEWTVWYPGGFMHLSFILHWIITILFQWIPALFLDMLIYLVRRETILIKIQKRLYHGTKVLHYFTKRDWDFDTKVLVKSCRSLPEKDQEIFYTIDIEYNIPDFFKTALLGTKQYCFKENMKNLPYLRMHMKILYILHYVCFIYFWFYLAKFFLSCLGYNF